MVNSSEKAGRGNANAAKAQAQSGFTLGLEANLGLTTDKLRNNVDAEERKG